MGKIKACRKWFIQTALGYLGMPYIWGGDDPSGFDCSGLVVECLKTIGFLGENDDLTADRLYRKYIDHEVDKAETGSLIFYFDDNGRAVHVVFALDEFFQIGASGGTSENVSIEKAWKNNAFVKIRPIGKNEMIKIVNLFNTYKNSNKE